MSTSTKLAISLDRVGAASAKPVNFKEELLVCALAACPLAGSAPPGPGSATARPSRARVAAFAAGRLSVGSRRTATLAPSVCGRVAAVRAIPEGQALLYRLQPHLCLRGRNSVVVVASSSIRGLGAVFPRPNPAVELTAPGVRQWVAPVGVVPPWSAAHLRRSASEKAIV